MIGWWDQSPIGPLRDVMWARPDGERVLLVDRPEAAAFITAVYEFDRVVEGPIEGAAGQGWLRLDAAMAGVSLDLRAGPGWRLPFGRLRPPWFTRRVEGPIARRVMAVTTFGTSPSGVHEWYRADEYRPLVAASATVEGGDAGAMVPFAQPAGFGFSEPPRRPAMVKVRPLLEDPSGRLDRVIATVRA